VLICEEPRGFEEHNFQYDRICQTGVDDKRTAFSVLAELRMGGASAVSAGGLSKSKRVARAGVAAISRTRPSGVWSVTTTVVCTNPKLAVVDERIGPWQQLTIHVEKIP